ncbi:MAG: hypothetical protein JXR52_06170 [Bacteroidales bacterium]|nr:hypothetical protein [Bacteroidales bacterium]MBN2698393.1 hypothetical protein [Bacteroidales bacterium]
MIGIQKLEANIQFKYIIALFILFYFIAELRSQVPDNESFSYPAGLTLQAGLGSYAVKDRYISPEKYSGIMPFYCIGWSHCHERNVYNLNFSFRQSEEIINNNVTTRIIQFRFSQGFLYPLKPFKVTGKRLGFWLGPTTDIAYYVNNPDIAVSGFDYTNSYVTMVSLGFRGDALYHISKRLFLKSSLQFTMVSLGLRTVDREEDDQPGAKILSPLSGQNGSFTLGIAYNAFRWLTVNVTYRSDLTRVAGWEHIISAGNSGVVGLTIRF